MWAEQKGFAEKMKNIINLSQESEWRVTPAVTLTVVPDEL